MAHTQLRVDTVAQTDLLVIGGGINGAGMARDAAGRGLKVVLCEQDDLGAATSSASSKLIHGGLRYLEHYEFRLVREALAEREVLLRTAPHLVHPLRFVMPHVPELRPAWMIRAGLFLYDYLARRQTLPGSRAIELRAAPYNAGLKPGIAKGFLYSDCRVDDARLVIANARAAADLGARVLPRTACVTARREASCWRAILRDASGSETTIRAQALINATGPWVRQFLVDRLHQPSPLDLRLVQGSHIVVPRLYAGDHAFILQNDDRRVVFVYPYEDRYALIGTTDVAFDGVPGACRASDAEIAYLCRAANRYFSCEIGPRDVVWSYCGIRPLFDDGSADPSVVTRDYVLQVDGYAHEAPLLSVFGGKITTYRRLAEHALEKLQPWFPGMRASWTGNAPLPGGEIGGGDIEAYCTELSKLHPALPQSLLAALARRHGSLAPAVLDGASSITDLGEHFGAQLYAREVDYLVANEWANTAEDVLWRRTKTGLHLATGQQEALARYLARRPS